MRARGRLAGLDLGGFGSAGCFARVVGRWVVGESGMRMDCWPFRFCGILECLYVGWLHRKVRGVRRKVWKMCWLIVDAARHA
jgi:hypothetical protein